MNLSDLSENQRITAFERKAQLDNIVVMQAEGRSLSDALNELDISKGKYYRWLKGYKTDGICGLIDGRAENRKGVRKISEAQYAYMCERMLREEKPYGLTVYWHDFIPFCDSIGEVPVSYPTFLRAFNEIPKAVRIKKRGGQKAYLDSNPYIIRDLNILEPMEVIQSDHFQMDIPMIGSTGRPTFPWVTWWMDMGTRMPLGWVLSENPNQDTINKSLFNTIRDFGVPKTAYIDNGRDYKSKMFTGIAVDGKRFKKFRMNVDELIIHGIYDLLNIRTVFALPYNSKAKSIEPTHRTLHNIERLEYGYRGPNVKDRTGYQKSGVKGGSGLDPSRLPRIDEMKMMLAGIMLSYANKKHKNLDNRTPAEVFNAKRQDVDIRKLDESALRLLMRKAGPKLYRVSANGVLFKGEWYYHEILVSIEGGKVGVRFDEDDIDGRGIINTIYIYDGHDAFLCQAQLTAKSPVISAKAKIFEDLNHRKKTRKIPVEQFMKDQQESLKIIAMRNLDDMAQT